MKKISPLASSLLALSLLVSACADDVATTLVTDGPSTGTTTATSTTAPTTVDPTTGTTTTGPDTTTTSTTTSTTDTSTTTVDPSTTTGVTTDSSGTDSSTTGPACTPGEPFCSCLNGTMCNNGAPCKFGECPPLSGMCKWEADGFCDEPDTCARGTDLYDCCATPQDGKCEEVSGGGACPKGSDWWDCGLCPYTENNACDEPVDCPPDSDPDCDFCPYQNDGWCDEPDVCPPGSDGADCCAVIQDGVCEEVGMGGMCPDGSDFYDCGYCPYQNDGWCDEPELCPPASDGGDCCATPQNGVCEELGMGGMCPDGSDFYDCGYCPSLNDGWCDEPEYCPPDSDGDDCCATPENGVCEEVDQGGVCPEGTDWVDCGECQWKNDGWCDEPDLCPEGTDGDDCCATLQDGICEEVGQGGACPDGTDFWDCGECPGQNNGFCEEPDWCPPGSDMADCCATPQNGQCEEIGEGGNCPDGSDYYDCGVCPWPNDGWCDEPDLCPPGSDNDCP